MITWTISQIDHTVNADGTAGDATNIHWRISKTVDALTAGSYGSTGITPPIPYDGITEADCIAYLEDTLDMEAMEAGLDAQIEAQGKPQTAAGLPWQDNYPQWMVGVDYVTNDVVTYQNVGYECLQAHTAQTTWPPAQTRNLWRLFVPISEGPQPWVQPQGGHDAYNTGDKVTHVDKTWESNMDGNVWEPADDSLQWDEVQ